ncbi:MAG: toll/interleukin-1 receptor domain-containing protein, partial [Candidatus Binataceae bacterium]
MIQQVLPEAEADIDLFISATSLRRELSARGERLAIDPRRVFMSHAAADAPLAILLKDEIERRIPGLSVFCSTYPGDIRLGFRWSAEIQHNLQEAAALILVATSRSIERNWVWFESGVFWFDRPIVICCLGDLQPDKLPPPLGEGQAITVATAEDLKLLLTQLSGIGGVAVADTVALDALASRIVELEQKAQSHSDAEQGWIGVAWQGNFLVCDGPIEELNLIDPEYYQESMKTALEAEGFRLVLIRRDQIGEYKDRGIKPVYVTDKRKWRKEVQKGDVLLV